MTLDPGVSTVFPKFRRQSCDPGPHLDFLKLPPWKPWLGLWFPITHTFKWVSASLVKEVWTSAARIPQPAF